MTASEPPAAKLSIRSLEGSRIVVTAMFNPKEVQVDKSVPWQKASSSDGEQSSLQFSSAEGRSMSFELLFDGHETGTNVHAAFVAKLLKLALAEVGGPDEKKRPPRASVTWGLFPEFQGVIESVSTKYTMFLPDGTPVRATCQLRIREASQLTVTG